MQEQGTEARDFVGELYTKDGLLNSAQVRTLRSLVDRRKILFPDQQEAIRATLKEHDSNSHTAILLIAAFINAVPSRS